MKNNILLLTLLFFLILNCGKQEKDQITLKVAHPYDPMASANLKESYNWFQKIADKFMRENPNVKIEFEIIKWDELDLKYMADYRANISHDIVVTSPQLMAQHHLVGDLIDLDQYIKKNDKYFQDMRWSPVWNTGIVDNKLYGLPFGTHTRVVAYRRDFFKECGLNPDITPTNLDELLEFAKKLTRDINGDGKTDVWGLGMNLGNTRATCELFFAPLVWHFGGNIWETISKKAIFANEAGVNATQFLYDLIYKYKVTPEWCLSGSYDDILMQPFLDGKIAMAWGWGTYWIQILEEKGWIKGLFPPTENGKADIVDIFVTPTRDNYQFENSWNVSIHKLSKNIDLSFEFIKYLLNPDELINFSDAGLPVHRTTWNKKEFQTPFYKKLLIAAEKGKGMPPTAHYTELSQTISSALQEIMVNKSDIRTTLKKFEDEYNSKYSGE